MQLFGGRLADDLRYTGTELPVRERMSLVVRHDAHNSKLVKPVPGGLVGRRRLSAPRRRRDGVDGFSICAHRIEEK